MVLLTNLKINPIVLIDDLSSELDEEKINSILLYLKTLKTQTFITNIHQNLSTIDQISPKVFIIENGEIKQKRLILLKLFKVNTSKPCKYLKKTQTKNLPLCSSWYNLVIFFEHLCLKNKHKNIRLLISRF